MRAHFTLRRVKRKTGKFRIIFRVEKMPLADPFASICTNFDVLRTYLQNAGNSLFLRGGYR